MKLPPVSDQPLDSDQRLARLGEARNEFLNTLIGDRGVYHLLRTDTKVDVGYWTGGRRVWSCLLDDELLLFALGRRSFVERISFEDLGESQYNHVTGEIVLAPIEITKVQTLRVPPLAALEMLTIIRNEDIRR